jgi:hypothetical protein
VAKETDAILHGAPDEGRTEGRLQEDIAPLGQSEVVPRHDLEPAEPGMDEAALDLRARIAAHLAAATFPATTEQLMEVARDDFASQDVMETLASLPAGETYEVVADVWRAAGGPVEHRD